MTEFALPDLTLGNKKFEYNPLIYGWTLKQVDDREIAVCKLMFHYRLVIQKSNSDTWEHGWCYSYPADPSGDLQNAVLQGLIWDPSTEPEPFGWLKRSCNCIRTLDG